jgi:hypothetical protein
MALIVLGAAGGTDARAAPPTDARALAAESYREAQSAFARREYAAAASGFEEAASLLPHPAALLSAAAAWERAGDPARAAEDCDRVRSLPNVAEASAADHVDYAADARACVVRVRPRAALLDVRGEGVLGVRIDDSPERALPLRQWLRSGHHVVVVRDLVPSQYGPRRLEVDVSRGEEKTLDVTAPPPPPPPRPMAAMPTTNPTSTPTPTPTTPTSTLTLSPTSTSTLIRTQSAPRRPIPTPSVVAFGMAACATVAWGIFAALTWAAHDDFNANPTQARADTFMQDRNWAYGAFGVAAVAAGVGFVLWVTSPSKPTHQGWVAPALVHF